jgi:hypothetical protein
MKPLTEASLQRLEASIPELASGAVRQAYVQALTLHGRVIEAINGQLLEITADGQTRVLRKIAAPTPSAVGLKRTRRAAPAKPCN